MPASAYSLKPAVRVALVVCALALAWQFTTVQLNYGGNWTALFCTGSAFPPPPLPEFRNTYVFQASNGYDGQFYRYIAHDPFFARGLTQWVGSARLRYTRILAPLAAYLLALGQPGAIDWTYFLVTYAFLGLGAWWAARYAEDAGCSAWWGLGFLAIPSVLVSLDRLTIDLAVAALCCAWARTWGREKKSSPAGWSLLTALPLARETMLLLSVPCAVRFLRGLRLRTLGMWALTLLPAGCWFVIVVTRTGPVGAATAGYWPLAGWLERVLHPVIYPAAMPLRGPVTGLDYAALAGMLLAALLALRLWLENRGGTIETAMLLFAVMIVWAPWVEVWQDSFAFGRVFAPLLLLLGARALDRKNPWLALPLVLVDLRVVSQFGTQVLGILRHL